ncbi:MAG: hypothetical protein C4524_04320 [Candidatus Zixiibacteriota bacterium]|nr:MAG: hypothetical protein C4524_04320 [candidate division Zixibacteria bacterium]
MLDKQNITAAGLILTLALGFMILQGCGEVTGDFSANQPPTVEIVNVPPDAAGKDTTQHYGMPFTVVLSQPVVILSMAGAEMLPNTEKVYAEGSADPFEPGVDYEMDYAAGTLTALSSGAMVDGSEYLIDFSFTVENYYVFSYAPTIHWVGFDTDGFVDFYRYADVTDTAFINGFRAASNPTSYLAQHSGQIVWKDTTAMEARIYLLTTEGDTTEHLFFVRAVDNLGTESQNAAFKTFYRSNNAPYNPVIKPQEQPDAAFTQNYVVPDTLFCLDLLTPNWQGISFNWKSNDPDDKELYQIPLEYTYYLVKTPGDTIWSWSNPAWNTTKQINLFGLETGSYTFSVWVRDDAFTLSAAPATITFKVIRPTFQYHLLVVDETKRSGTFEVPGDGIRVFWENLLYSLEGQLTSENYVMDGVDVRFLNNYDLQGLSSNPAPLPYALVSQYKMVLIFSGDHYVADNGVYIPKRNGVLADYLDIGGRLWMEGRRIANGSFGYPAQPLAFASDSFCGKYLKLETGLGSNLQATSQKTEFQGAVPVIPGMPEFVTDSTKVSQMTSLMPNIDRSLMPDVDWYTRSDDAMTLYTFKSVTSDTVKTNPNVYGEDAKVDTGATPIQCVLDPKNDNLLAVYQVFNKTKGVTGQVANFNTQKITVSYPYGPPWEDTDSLEVDYRYDPISEMHLKPVAVRYEDQPRISEVIEIQGIQLTRYTYVLGYRTAVFAFPLYFMKNDQGEVEEVVKEMLDWFFYPTIHWEL